MKVLVIDIGGSHVKLCVSGCASPATFDSGPDLTPQRLVEQVRKLSRDWKFDAISIGYPGRVGTKGPEAEPGNLGNGWVGFDFEKAFAKPVRVVNDAAMQALGGYDNGRMLFLGLGTGLGSALVAHRVVIPLELGNLNHKSGRPLWQRLGKDGLAELGNETWQRDVAMTTTMLREAMDADYVLLGGGNAELVDPLPPDVRRGGNDDAFAGGIRLWEEIVEPHDRRPSSAWRVV
jgi:polyphosphate glucokinase